MNELHEAIEQATGRRLPAGIWALGLVSLFMGVSFMLSEWSHKIIQRRFEPGSDPSANLSLQSFSHAFRAR